MADKYIHKGAACVTDAAPSKVVAPVVAVAAPAVVVVAAPGVAGCGHLLPVVVCFLGD